ncbi:MAG: hypothetical protein ACOC0U_05055 [Desulfovibrionales bacterium]
MGTAVFLELFWLDFIPAGTFIPPHSILSIFLTFATISLLDLTTSSEIALVLVATVPLAWLGSRVEEFQRTLQNSSYNSLVTRIRRGLSSPVRLIGRSVLQSFLLQFGLFVLLQTTLFFFFEFLFSHWGDLLASNPVSWPQLWILATLGPILSLRHRLPYIYFGLTVIVIGVVMWLAAAFPHDPPL